MMASCFCQQPLCAPRIEDEEMCEGESLHSHYRQWHCRTQVGWRFHIEAYHRWAEVAIITSFHHYGGKMTVRSMAMSLSRVKAFQAKRDNKGHCMACLNLAFFNFQQVSLQNDNKRKSFRFEKSTFLCIWGKTKLL